MAMVQRGLTLEEFLRLPEQKPALEYADGVVTQKVSPKNRHVWLQWSLVEDINHVTLPRQIAAAFFEQRCTSGGFSRVPDVTVIRWDRLPLDQHGELLDEFFGAPDIAVEILSPGQSVRDLVERCRWYVDNGVALALAVHTRDRFVLAFRPGAPERHLSGADEIELAPLIPDYALSVDKLFGALRFRRD